jgi:hypothetical protein
MDMVFFCSLSGTVKVGLLVWGPVCVFVWTCAVVDGDVVCEFHCRILMSWMCAMCNVYSNWDNRRA